MLGNTILATAQPGWALVPHLQNGQMDDDLIGDHPCGAGETVAVDTAQHKAPARCPMDPIPPPGPGPRLLGKVASPFRQPFVSTIEAQCCAETRHKAGKPSAYFSKWGIRLLTARDHSRSSRPKNRSSVALEPLYRFQIQME